MNTQHTNRSLFWNEGSPDIFANWYADKNVKIATVITPAWHEDKICGGREAGANADRIVRCWNSHDELVEALDMARRYMKMCLGSSFWDGPNPHPIIDAALAKARGEA
ncbi:hypothetical protein ACNT8L_05850 [Brucella intermedia]|uniref:hypothetical protein n=1 Tax=Brucella intermedia TaxID=94625 RepID=UPI003AB7FAD8